MTISPEMTDMGMNLAAALASEEIAKALGCSRTEALERFLASDTGAALYDDSLKLWWESPHDIAAAYLRESAGSVNEETRCECERSAIVYGDGCR